MAKKIFKFISSMRFAICLLILLAICCALGSFVTQNQSFAWYAERYSERTAAWITALQLNDLYHSWWFLGISLFLCCNLLLCNIIRLPQLILRTREAGDPSGIGGAQVQAYAEHVDRPEELFQRLHMPKPRRTELDGQAALFSSAHRAGLWGAWVCHIGILLLIAGFTLGQATHQEYAVYGVAGQTRQIGDTQLFLTIDDFQIDLRRDDTVSQYTSQITVRDLSGKNALSRQASISVNHPATLFGYRFYQNSTGWAARVRVEKGDEALQDEVLCAGEYLPIEDLPDLVIFFHAFYPDLIMDPAGGPRTASGQLNNPGYLYSVYYQNQIVGMNVLTGDETITIDDYTVTFSEPQSYTVIQCKRDRFSFLALVGGLAAMLGLFLAFYLQPKRVWAVSEQTGGWSFHGACPKMGALFRDQFEEAVRAISE